MLLLFLTNAQEESLLRYFASVPGRRLKETRKQIYSEKVCAHGKVS